MKALAQWRAFSEAKEIVLQQSIRERWPATVKCLPPLNNCSRPLPSEWQVQSFTERCIGPFSKAHQRVISNTS